MNIEIRNATSGDLAAIIQLLKHLDYHLEDVDALEKVFQQILAHPDMMVLVAELVDQGIVSYMCLSVKPQLRLVGHSVELDELVVSPECRSSGVGKKMLEYAKRWAREKNAVRIILSTNKKRESYKRGFYEKNGYCEAESASMRLYLNN